jgi:surface antigen
MNANLRSAGAVGAVGAVLMLAFSLGGCATDRVNENAGMVIGGVLGGIGGSQIGKGTGRTAAIIVGTMAGAAIGGAVGRNMDETDQLKASYALENVRTGVPSSWHNPDTGSDYVITPTRTFDSTQGPCREYTMEAMVGGRSERVYGTACRQPDGSWRIQN